MSFSDLRARIRNAKYRVLSDPATWNGAPVAVRQDSRDRVVGFGDSSAILPALVLSVRMADVPVASEGDIAVITATGQTYRISAQPVADHTAGEWICEAELSE